MAIEALHIVASLLPAMSIGQVQGHLISLGEIEMFVNVLYVSLFDMGLWGVLHGYSEGEYMWDLP